MPDDLLVVIALDANIWVAERLLRSATGVAFIHAIRRMGVKLLLPDVTRMEVVAGVVREGGDAVRQVTSGFLTIQSLMGVRPDCSLFSSDNFRRAADERLDELSAMISDVIVTIEHHDRALSRVTEHRPPAETREQYRDCLLWEVLMDHLEDGAILVSNDRDFADQRKTGRGLAGGLRQECGDRVDYYASLADCLKAIEPRVPPMDAQCIRDAVVAAVSPVATEFAQSKGLELGPETAWNIDLYATEEVGSTTGVFDWRLDAHNLTLPNGALVPDATLRFTGDCIIRDSVGVEGLSMKGIDAYGRDGERLPFGIAYASAAFVMGGIRHVPFSVRARIPGDERDGSE